MKKLIYALRFMTIIPIPWKEGENMKQVARSISFFPIVGLIIGLSNWGVYYLSDKIFSPVFTSVAVVVWWIFVTGGLHLDGLGDTADGIWGGTSREKRLEIMKDSRSGIFGVLTLISFLLLKTAGLYELFSLHNKNIPFVIISIPIIGRWVSVFSIYFFKTARSEGLGYFFKENIGLKELTLSLILTMGILYYFTGIAGLVSLIIVTFFSALASLFFKSKLGGLSGDIYGALCELSELLSLILLLIFTISGFIA